MSLVDHIGGPVAAPVRRVIRGAGASRVDGHDFTVVGDLPSMTLSRPVASGDHHVDALRSAAWEEGYAEGHREGATEGRAAGHAEGFEIGHREGRAAAHAEGLAAGRAEADTELSRRVSASLASLEAAAADLRHRDTVVLADIETQVVDLAVQLAAAVLGREVATLDGVASAAVRTAIDLAPERGELVVRINPDDLAVVAQGAPLAPGREVELVADPSVGRGGCVVESDATRVDARIEAALARARQILLGTETDPAALA